MEGRSPNRPRYPSRLTRSRSQCPVPWEEATGIFHPKRGEDGPEPHAHVGKASVLGISAGGRVQLSVVEPEPTLRGPAAPNRSSPHAAGGSGSTKPPAPPSFGPRSSTGAVPFSSKHSSPAGRSCPQNRRYDDGGELARAFPHRLALSGNFRDRRLLPPFGGTWTIQEHRANSVIFLIACPAARKTRFSYSRQVLTPAFEAHDDPSAELGLVLMAQPIFGRS